MRYLTVFLLASISFLSNAQSIIVSGNISNQKGGKVYVYLIGGSRNHVAEVDEDGCFHLEIEKAEEGYYGFNYGERQMFYATPGDSLYVGIDPVYFDETINYSGIGAEKSNFLKEKYMIYEYTNCDNAYNYKELVNSRPEKTAGKLINVQNLLLNMLSELKDNTEKISRSFILSETNKIKVHTLYYISQMYQRHVDKGLGINLLYTDSFMEKYIYPNIFQDTSLFEDDEYRISILYYIDYIARREYQADSNYYKNSSYGYSAAAIQAILKNQDFADEFKDYCLYHFLKTNYIDDYYMKNGLLCYYGYYTMNGHQELYEDFKKYCGNEHLKNRIEKNLNVYSTYLNYLEECDSTVLKDRKFISWLIYKGYMHASASRVDKNYYNFENRPDEEEYFKIRMEAVNKNIGSELLRNFIVFHYTYNHISSTKADYSRTIVELFEKYCTSGQYKDRILELLKNAGQIKEGQKAPVFTAKDIEGREYSMEDLQGKYVYIDVWATWCGPCLSELPILEKLQESYKDKNITFVSISIDKDFEAWKKMIKEKEMKGLQLIVADAWESDLCKKYMITGIPHFILIDPEGNIVSKKAPRPSEEISKKFEELGL